MLLSRSLLPTSSGPSRSALQGTLGTLRRSTSTTTAAQAISAQMDDPLNAYIDLSCRKASEKTDGPLAGLSFCVKDLFDVSGFPTGNGNPVWKETHPIPTVTAPAVTALLEAGAAMVGKTHMDELAYSLNGENVHYGTPRNPAASLRIPGGSSSGSAAAVAGGTADIGLGSDTAGSVRIPASYCGLFGYRPSHGRISLEAARPLAPSYDTTGIFTRDAGVLLKAGRALLKGAPGPSTAECAAPPALRRLIVARDAFALAERETAEALEAVIKRNRDAITQVLSLGEGSISIGSALGGPEQWLGTFRVLQGAEVWACNAPFVQGNVDPKFGPGIWERFEMASKITAEEVKAAAAVQDQVRALMKKDLDAGTVWLIPTAPGPAPILRCPQAELEEFRRRALSLTCIAGLSGLPQITLPAARVPGRLPGEGPLPVGLSLVGPRGSDEELLGMARRLWQALDA